jgi:type IX secretion system PorP/SprF family membrane protein
MRANPYAPILFFLLAILSSTSAQQVPFLNQYAWNPNLFNPAAQGSAGEGQITAVYRSQFQNLDASVRPTTYLLHADLSPLVHERIGLAAQVMGDKTHLLSRFQFSGFFGYHLIKTAHLRFSLGAAAGIRTQRLDFTGRRVADVLDLAVFNEEINATRFDGGPGLALEYQTSSGSVFALDATAAQIFSSDIRIQGAGNAVAAYDLVPHLLLNARYRYQGAGFALEPTIAFRALAGGYSLQSGLFDANLNAYFLKRDLLMAGVGLRTDQGGVRFQLGVRPTPSIRLLASAELHSALGTTFEVGASYLFGNNRPEPAPEPVFAPPIAPAPSENLVQTEYDEIRALAQMVEQAAANVRDRQSTIGTAIVNNASMRDFQKQTAAADSCAALLTQVETDIRQIRQNANGIKVKRLQADQVVRNATARGAQISDETRATLLAISELTAEATGQLSELEMEQKNLLEKCGALRPQRNEAGCIRANDADCVQELFAASLSQTLGLSANLFPLRTFVAQEAAAITYHYADDDESYSISPELLALARHITAQIRQVEQQGARLDQINLFTELQEDKNTLGYQLGLQYDGLLGNNPIAYNLVDNETGASVSQSLSLAASSPVNLETLGALKVAALRAFLIRQGIAASRITLQVRFNHTENIYREETKIMVKFRGN